MFIVRYILKRRLSKLIFDETIVWASDWYIMSVLDEETDAHDRYWNTTKPNQEQRIASLCSLLIEIKHKRLAGEKKFTVKQGVEKIHEIYTR